MMRSELEAFEWTHYTGTVYTIIKAVWVYTECREPKRNRLNNNNLNENASEILQLNWCYNHIFHIPCFISLRHRQSHNRELWILSCAWNGIKTQRGKKTIENERETEKNEKNLLFNCKFFGKLFNYCEWVRMRWRGMKNEELIECNTISWTVKLLWSAFLNFEFRMVFCSCTQTQGHSKEVYNLFFWVIVLGHIACNGCILFVFNSKKNWFRTPE